MVRRFLRRLTRRRGRVRRFPRRLARRRGQRTRIRRFGSSYRGRYWHSGRILRRARFSHFHWGLLFLLMLLLFRGPRNMLFVLHFFYCYFLLTRSGLRSGCCNV
jgi:hypothetical protein